MIRHCVMLRLRPDHDVSELTAVMQGLGDVAKQLPGCSGFVHGPNRDFEANSPGYPFGFTLDFAAEADLHRYADDDTHRQLGARLVALCTGGGDGIMVFDLEFPDPAGQ
ncbi:Stress responsive A/B Barrel Domain [Ruegeria halocynthiae]|uniref:Stress responsive A/B Barrel Domain n=1 Tax=Ruegeria halocynthiae TaxID=985054 RepID=A0A1H3CWD1_9RHOB|nr:Dabb family protein [Ruegeria halocynthiae]SDX58513.1 Stress responsive A/B Barrel Domain [Ruegeria halocynthiae]